MKLTKILPSMKIKNLLEEVYYNKVDTFYAIFHQNPKVIAFEIDKNSSSYENQESFRRSLLQQSRHILCNFSSKS